MLCSQPPFDKETFGIDGLETRLDNLFDYIRTEYTHHLRPTSHIAAHCLRSKLGSRANEKLNTPCDHGVVKPVPELWEDTEGGGHWNNECERCGKHGGVSKGGKTTARFFFCKYCNLSCCRACLRVAAGNGEVVSDSILKSHNYVCSSCSSDLEEATHSSKRCSHCDEIEFFKRDIRSMLERCLTHPSIPIKLKDDLKTMCTRLCVAIDKFCSHICRTHNQNQYWSDQLERMKSELDFKSFMIMSDFWAKWDGTSNRKANCDIGDKQSVETHCVWSLLPPSDQVGVNWSDYPDGAKDIKPDVNGFRGFAVNIYNLFSDDITQSAHQAFCNFLSTVSLHHNRFPWQIYCRRQTDGAGQYNSFKVCLHGCEVKKITKVHLIELVHPEPGHGGNQCDKENANCIAAAWVITRETGEPILCPTDAVLALMKARMKGHTHLLATHNPLEIWQTTGQSFGGICLKNYLVKQYPETGTHTHILHTHIHF